MHLLHGVGREAAAGLVKHACKACEHLGVPAAKPIRHVHLHARHLHRTWMCKAAQACRVHLCLPLPGKAKKGRARTQASTRGVPALSDLWAKCEPRLACAHLAGRRRRLALPRLGWLLGLGNALAQAHYRVVQVAAMSAQIQESATWQLHMHWRHNCLPSCMQEPEPAAQPSYALGRLLQDIVRGLGRGPASCRAGKHRKCFQHMVVATVHRCNLSTARQ